jgi:hypothetical protein
MHDAGTISSARLRPGAIKDRALLSKERPCGVERCFSKPSSLPRRGPSGVDNAESPRLGTDVVRQPRDCDEQCWQLPDLC